MTRSFWDSQSGKADEKEIEFVFDYEKELETCTIMQDKRWLGYQKKALQNMQGPLIS